MQILKTDDLRASTRYITMVNASPILHAAVQLNEINKRQFASMSVVKGLGELTSRGAVSQGATL